MNDKAVTSDVLGATLVNDEKAEFLSFPAVMHALQLSEGLLDSKY